MRWTIQAMFAAFALATPTVSADTAEQPNVIVILTDDISAREIPFYGSTVWSDLTGADTTDPALRASTPVMDRLAEEGVWFQDTWSATICSPTRAMIMSGRYPTLTKWWHNNDVGQVMVDGKPTRRVLIPETSPLLIGHIAGQAGYATMWCGKLQMYVQDLDAYGFDEVIDTPGQWHDWPSPHTDFYHEPVERDGEKVLLNADTGDVAETYLQLSWYWQPSAQLLRHPTAAEPGEFWPNTEEAQADYGLHTYGPDVELDFILDFIERQHDAGTPFFVYHTSHLGHDAFDWIRLDSPSKWPGTPKVEWTGDGYVRTDPKITGDNGVYDLHDTVTEPGMHRHVEYLDYQLWLYLEKLEALGIADNTVIIFTSDNGTSGYGKAWKDRQKGTHVPMLIYAPGLGLTKRGQQDVVASLADILPTLADIVGTELPDGYEIHGESFWPFLTTDAEDHRPWIYSWSKGDQMIRGHHVLFDGHGKWWDVSEVPEDLISFPQITDWSSVSEAHRAEREKLESILPQFDTYHTEFNVDADDLPTMSSE